MISQFTGKHRFLSNFYIEPDGTNVEAEYQAEKCAEEKDKFLFYGKNPYIAKRIGRQIKLRPDWEEIKLGVMSALVLRKFEDSPYLMKLLLETDNEDLIEGNTWGDTYWGVCNKKGKNHLGEILMTVRQYLRK